VNRCDAEKVSTSAAVCSGTVLSTIAIPIGFLFGSAGGRTITDFEDH
jgi:hypothetical protein